MKKAVLLVLLLPLFLWTLNSLTSPVLANEDTSLNYTVPDVLAAFKDLSRNGEVLGYRLAPDTPRTSTRGHIEGIQRRPGPGTPYFFISRAAHEDAANIFVVEMGSRDTSGERLRSNRLMKDAFTLVTLPPEMDRVVHTISFAGTNGWPGPYHHIDGIQMVGDILAAGLYSPYGTAPPPSGMVVLVDVANPTNPVLLHEMGFDHGVDAIAITQQPDGKFLMVVMHEEDGELLVYKSNVTDLRDPNLSFDLIDTWSYNELEPADAWWPSGSDIWGGPNGYQSINFVQQTDGQLFLIGTRGTAIPEPIPSDNENWAELYRVEFRNGDFKLIVVDSKAFNQRWSLMMDLGNWRAAAAFYVSPSGELILYTAPHWDEELNDIPMVTIGEFRNKYVYRAGSPLLRPVADVSGDHVREGGSVTLNGLNSLRPSAHPWAQLFQHDNFWGRWIVFDWEDRYKDDFDNLDNHDDFTDEASSVIWQAPVGCDIILYEHDSYGGEQLRLAGTGGVDFINNLDNYGWTDRVSSIAFTGNVEPDMTYLWDLDSDGIFETNGATPEFSAALLDGHSYIGIGLKVIGPYLDYDIDRTFIDVDNVPPTAAIDSMIQPNPQFILPIVHTLTFTGSFTDPGVLDTHTASWDFGDGTIASGTLTEENTAPDSTGTATANHAYSNPGTYTVTLTITDDDGGAATDTMQVTVIGAEEVKDLLDQYVQDLEDSAFKSVPTQRKNAFANMFVAISDMLADKEWNGAIQALLQIRTKADGYVDGNPRDDWIIDPVAQQEICMMIDDLVAHLKTFL